jgi:hypothetical protein
MKRKMLLIAALLISFAVLMPTSALGCRRQPPRCEVEPPVEICKTPFCLTYPGPGPGEPGDRYSSNPIAMDDGIPVYPTHMKLYWWIEINVTANVDLEYVVVYDRLGAEFMVEGIYTGGKLPKPGPDPEPNLTYTFDYGKDTEVERITRGQTVDVKDETGTLVATGTVGWRGVSFDGDFAGDIDAFFVFWTGRSCKAHFKWTIGPMEENESKIIYLVISTDINPGGHQEFTSPGITYLNSGATVKVLKQRTYRRCWFMWRPFYSASTDPIPIIVEEI